MSYVVTEQEMLQLDSQCQQQFGQNAPFRALFRIVRSAFDTYILFSATTSAQDLVSAAVRALAGCRVDSDCTVTHQGVPVAMLVPFVFTNIDTGVENHAVAVACVFPQVFGRDASIECLRGQDVVRTQIRGLSSSSFATAEAGIAWGPDGNTNIGISITDSIGRSIITAGVESLQNYVI